MRQIRSVLNKTETPHAASLVSALIVSLSEEGLSAQSPSTDVSGRKSCLQHYPRSRRPGRKSSEAFHPDARMTFVRDGNWDYARSE